MTGFIRGLFGSKANKAAEAGPQPPEAAPSTNGKAEAFYLDADDAKTLGDINYMRASKSIRRTFPKTASTAAELEMIQQVSATEKASAGEGTAIASGNGTALEQITAAQPGAPTPPVTLNGNGATPALERTSTPDMDIFRNMARDMKKR